MDDDFEPDPESGEAIAIPLVERCPKLRAIFEALRHELHPPDFTGCDTESEQPRPTRSRSALTSSESQSQPNKQLLAPFQHTITPPTDAECGLPSPISEALSNIPANLLPLSRTLASPQIAAVINGHTRSELSESLAHAANLRRASGRARAILVITSSEKAVQEWIAGMCQALDEVQIISYSRAKAKRKATLLRLGQAQYPGIVVATERSLRDGVQELWEALRQNRVAKKWEIVFSEVVTDKNIEGECSPLRMIRDGTAEKCVIAGRKGLSKKRASKFASNLHGVDAERGFWLRKEDIRNTATEEGCKAASDAPVQPPAPRRRSPRLRSSQSADRESTPSATGKGQSKQGKRKSGELRKMDGLDANGSASGKKQGSKLPAYSDISSGNGKSSMCDSEYGDENASIETREKIKSRARALRLFSSGSSNSSEEKFFTPPSHAPTPQSKDTTPEKFFSPRTSFSPKKPVRGPVVDRLPKSRKSIPDHFLRLSLSPTKPRKSRTIKKVAAKSHKSIAQMSFSSGSPSSPVKRADLTRKRNQRLNVGCSSSDDQRMSRKSSSMKEETERNAVARAARNRMLDSDSFDDQPLVDKRGSLRESTGRTAVKKSAKNRRLELSYESSDDQPLVGKRSGRKTSAEGNVLTAAAKTKRLNFHSSDNQPLITKSSDLKQKSRRSEGKGAFTPRTVKRKFPSKGPPYVQEEISPVPARRSVPVCSSPNITTGAGKSGGGRRRSIFDEFRSSSDAQLIVPHAVIARAKSLPAPIQVKREESPVRQGFIWTWGNPKYKNSAKRRKSLPTPSSSSFLPVRRALPKPGTLIQVTAPEAFTTKRIPRLARDSPSGRHGSATPRHKSPVTDRAAQSRRTEPEVIVISSGTEDEVTPRPSKAARKRRIYDQNEARNDSGSVLCTRSGNGTSSRGKSASPVLSRPREKLANANSVGSRSRSMRHNDGAAVARSDDLRNFVRGINRNRKVKDLSRKQMLRYNKLVAEAKRFENLEMKKEAIESYEKCVQIYDGDMDLTNRYLALLTKEGWLQSDMAQRPAKSPISKRSRRRRNSGRRGQAGPSTRRVEVIDLTSA